MSHGDNLAFLLSDVTQRRECRVDFREKLGFVREVFERAIEV
jgi:hypothetical protein